jgi:hypothetical protein
MKTVKRILLVIGILIAIPLVSALFMKSEYAVEREVVINKPLSNVFGYVKFLKNQDNYSKWAQMDPAMKKDFRGTDGQPGAVSSWDSQMDDVGQGEQEIKAVEENKRIDYELRFIRPMESTEHAYIATDAVSENQTRVKWGFQGKMPYPFNFMGAFMNFDEMIGKDLETGLVNLKTLLERE